MFLNGKIQLNTSYHIKYFHNYALRHFGFSQYRNLDAPTVFFGCYDNNDIQIMRRHRGPKALIWGGTDIQLGHAKFVVKIKSLIHLAQSEYIMRDLRKLGVKNPIYIPFAPTVDENKFYPVKKGNAIYIYTNPKKPATYGANIYLQIMRRFSHIPFILASSYQSLVDARRRGINTRGIQSFEPNQIWRVYSQCFLALRLTQHDGISATVQELGLMGIPTVCNGITPSCLNYKNLEDIINIINQEYKKIGTIDEEMAQKVKIHLNDASRILMSIFNMELPMKNMYEKVIEMENKNDKMVKKITDIKSEKIFLLTNKIEKTTNNNKYNIIFFLGNDKKIKNKEIIQVKSIELMKRYLECKYFNDKIIIEEILE